MKRATKYVKFYKALKKILKGCSAKAIVQVLLGYGLVHNIEQ